MNTLNKLDQNSANIYLKSVYYNNIRTFKDVKITLGKQGLVLISGKNGAGKSSLWDLLHVAFFGCTPSGHRKNELNTRHNKEAVIGCKLLLSGKEYDISYRRVKEKSKWKWTHQIIENGVDISDHDPNSVAKSVVDKLGMSAKEFTGSIHLCQNSQHTLIEDKPSDRKKYISDFFGLDQRYDEVLEAAKIEYDRVKTELKELDSLIYTRQALNEELAQTPFIDSVPLESQKNTIQILVNELTSRLSTLREMTNIWNVYDRHIVEASKYDNPSAIISELEIQVTDLKAREYSAALIVEHNKRAILNNQTFSSLVSEMLSIEEKCSQVLDQNYDTSSDRYNYLKNLKDKNKSIEAFRNKLSQIPNISLIDIEQSTQQLSELSAKYNILSHRCSAISSGQCPTCGSSFDKLKIQSEFKEIEILRKQIEDLKVEIKNAEVNNKMFVERQNLEKLTSGFDLFTEDNEHEFQFLGYFIPLKTRHNELNSLICNMSKMELKEEINISEIKQKVTELSTNLSEVKTCLYAKSLLPSRPALSREEITSELSTINTSLMKSSAELQALAAKIVEISTINSRHLRIKGNIDAIDQKLQNLPKLKKDEYFWSKMVEAYGSKGLRVQQLEKIMAIVMQRLPYYTGVLFGEKGLSFYHKCDSGSIDIFAKRTETVKDDRGKEKIVNFEHDVSSFSGGERKRLSVAFVLTLADCVSYKKKSNVLVLDEIDSNLDAEGQFRFVNDLLPMLRDNYESVFIISHSEEIQQADIYNQIWTVVKDNHWSTVNTKIINGGML